MQKNFFKRLFNFKRTYTPEDNLKPVYIVPRKKVRQLAAIYHGSSFDVDLSSLSLVDYMVVSPLHDQDETKDGFKRKPHYHLLFYFNEPIYLDIAVRFLEDSGFCSVKECFDDQGYINYMIHKDSLEMVNYSHLEIRYFARKYTLVEQ